MFWEKIKGYSKRSFKRLTGVEKKTLKLMAREVRAQDEKRIKKQGHNRGRPFDLIIEDQILMTLMYYREYLTQFHIGETYGLSEGNVSRNISRIEKILKKCKQFKLPGKEVLASTNHQYEVILIDATESPIERPKKNNTYTIQGKRKNIQ